MLSSQTLSVSLRSLFSASVQAVKVSPKKHDADKAFGGSCGFFFLPLGLAITSSFQANHIMLIVRHWDLKKMGHPSV